MNISSPLTDAADEGADAIRAIDKTFDSSGSLTTKLPMKETFLR